MSEIFLVKLDATEFKEVEKRLGPYFYRKAPVVISRALNRAAGTARTTATKNASQNYYVKQKDIRETMHIYKASPSRLGASVISEGNVVPLDKFRYSPKQPRPKRPPRALKVAVKKGDGVKELRHSFVANVNGNKIFQRRGKNRLPIDRLLGPSVPQIIGNEKTRAEVEKESVEMYQKRLDHEINQMILVEGKKI